MKLFLNTSNNLKTIIKLDDKEFIKNYQSPRDQDVMGALIDTLNQSHKTIQDLTQIEIFTGPGSFTGLRVGIAIANALSFALNLPINNQPPGTIIEPYYGQPPSITLSPKNRH